MQNLRVLRVFPDQRTVETYRFELIVEIFAMFKWKVEEHSQERWQLAVKSGCDRVTAHQTRVRISRKCAWGVAKNVARELIEQQDQREATPRRALPLFKTLPRGIFMAAEKTPALLVEFRIGNEPS